MTRRCERCGAEFLVPANYPEKRFCSRGCSCKATSKARSEARKKGTAVTKCAVCGEEFEHPVYQKRRCCSRACASKLPRQLPATITKECLWCGEEFTVNASLNRQKYCSYSCSSKALAEKRAEKARQRAKELVDSFAHDVREPDFFRAIDPNLGF